MSCPATFTVKHADNQRMRAASRKQPKSGGTSKPGFKFIVHCGACGKYAPTGVAPAAKTAVCSGGHTLELHRKVRT
jgi:hypothetical protein